MKCNLLNQMKLKKGCMEETGRWYHHYLRKRDPRPDYGVRMPAGGQEYCPPLITRRR